MGRILVEDKLREEMVMLEYDKVTKFYLVIAGASLIITLIGAVVL